MPSRRRGVSEIIGSLIILLIVTTLGTYLYNHSLTIISYQQESLETELIIASERAQERLKITAIWWSPIYDVLNITVFNYGSSETQVSDVYINNERVVNYLSGRNQVIDSMELTKVVFEPPSLIDPETLFEIVIVSQRGVTHAYRTET